ncbi:MAG TPA: endolytic transglycosylase MltG [Candidatus Baltobacteraceae bacterium]|nr:endolytic transglycosylase MltG [Candidatus Baltobacteraceae bacterium]
MKGLFLTTLIAVLFGGFVFAQAGRPVSKEPSTILYAIPQGSGAKAIAEGLKKAKLIRSPKYFLFTVWSRGDQAKFKAGTYELTPSMSTREIEAYLAKGEPASDEISVTLLEGWTLDDIADHLQEAGLATREEFYAEAGESAKSAWGLPDWSSSYPALASRPAGASLEGYLFPDTYRVYADGGAKPLVRRMLDNFEDKLTPDLRAEIKAQGRTIHEIVTMASIIEREVRSDEDRALVSGIFWKRVEAGRGLEADSTVNYITGHSKPSVSYEDTRIDHPWNTYRYRGLPPGPIGNPSLSAIIAAIRPKTSPYWYFLTDPEGKVWYGRTLDEHNENRVNHLR